MHLLYHIILFYKYNLLIEYLLFDSNKNRSNYVSEATNCLTNNNTICEIVLISYKKIALKK